MKITWILAGPHGMNSASLRSRILCKLLWTWKDRWIVRHLKEWKQNLPLLLQNKISEANQNEANRLLFDCMKRKTLNAFIYLSWINFSLDDIQNGNITMVSFPISRRCYHHIFGLKRNKKYLSNQIYLKISKNVLLKIFLVTVKHTNLQQTSHHI